MNYEFQSGLTINNSDEGETSMEKNTENKPYYYSEEANLFRFVFTLCHYRERMEREKDKKLQTKNGEDEIFEEAGFGYDEQQIKDIYESLSYIQKRRLNKLRKIFNSKENGSQLKFKMLFSKDLSEAWQEYGKLFTKEEREKVTKILGKFNSRFVKFNNKVLKENEKSLNKQEETLNRLLNSEEFKQGMEILNKLFGQKKEKIQVHVLFNYSGRNHGGAERHGSDKFFVSFKPEEDREEIIRLLTFHELIHCFQGEKYREMVEKFTDEISEEILKTLGLDREVLKTLMNEAVAINISKFLALEYG